MPLNNLRMFILAHSEHALNAEQCIATVVVEPSSTSRKLASQEAAQATLRMLESNYRNFL